MSYERLQNGFVGFVLVLYIQNHTRHESTCDLLLLGHSLIIKKKLRVFDLYIFYLFEGKLVIASTSVGIIPALAIC